MTSPLIFAGAKQHEIRSLAEQFRRSMYCFSMALRKLDA
jgi:hypothetical protein